VAHVWAGALACPEERSSEKFTRTMSAYDPV
jgi:hypothetical protein